MDPETAETRFGRRLRAERERQRMTQAELAYRMTELGAPLIPSALSKSEAGKRLVRLNEAVAAAASLGVPLGALLADDSDLETQIAELRHAAKYWTTEADSAQRRAAQFAAEADMLTA